MGKNLLGTNVITQVGVLVHDVEKTAKKYADFFGINEYETTVVDGYEISKAEFRNKKMDAAAKIIHLKITDQLEIELIEPDSNPSTWREELDKKGEGMHHIAFVVNHMAEKIKLMEEHNMPLLQKGEYEGGRYVYFDALEELKLIIELLENDETNTLTEDSK